MRIMQKLWRRAYFLLHRRRLERELAEEMEIHREMMPPDRRSDFGNAMRLREESREAWTWIWLQQFWQDLSYGARVLSRAPAFTLGAVAVLALGVGVNLAEFQIFDAMIFHRLTIRDVDSLLQLSRASRQGRRLGFPPAAVEFYRAESSSFAWLVAEDTTLEVAVEGDTGLRSNLVSANYFSSLAIVPAWGRLLDARDAQPGAPAVAVLGYQYWQTHWAADPHVVGRVVHVNNKPVEIVGVVPYSFEGLMARGTAVWFPVAIRPLLIAGSLPIQQDFSRASEALFGKLKTSVSQAAGEAELTSLTRELIRRQPRYFRDDERIQGELVQESMVRGAGRNPAIAIFIVMVLLVLLSACANLGNMLLARGLARQREIDIRVAIGASRARVVRQLMTENFLLAILGSAAGLVFGAMAARLLMNAMGAPPSMHLSISWPILVAGLVLTLLSAVAFGLPAALQTVRANHRKSRLRQSLVGVQVAVSCLLLIASGVLAHNGILSASLDLAFDYRNMVVIYPQLYAQNLPAAIARQKLDALSTRLSALPGVDGVTAAVAPPLGGRRMIDSLPGLPHVYRNAVASSYFTLMNLPVVRGRAFLPGEQNAVIVSESAARAVWPNQDPVGKIWNLAGAERTVAGVVKDSGANLLADAESIEAYVPMQDVYVERSALILHTRGDPAPLMRMVPAAAAAADETVSVSLMRSSRDGFLEGQRKMVTLIGSIGAVATALAAAGMFALVAFAVAQRKRELGIRIAIGARPRHILGVLLTQNAKPTASGVVAGAILAVILSRLVRSLIILQNRDAVDVPGFVAGIACFVLVAALATLSPAMRALRIDPSATLREE
jgi:predicted permease